MKTDYPISLFLAAGAEAFRVLTVGLRQEGGYLLQKRILSAGVSKDPEAIEAAMAGG